MDEAVRRVTGDQLAQLMFPRFVESGDATQLTQGMNASPGAAVGKAVFSSEDAVEWAEQGREGRPGPPGDQPRRPVRDDRRRGRAHQPRRQDLARRRRRPRHGQDLRLRRRGAEGRHQEEAVHRARRHRSSTRATSSRSTARPAGCGSARCRSRRRPSSATSRARSHPDADEADDLVRSVHRILTHADEKRRLEVRTNADTPEDSARARRFGAQGIGLCRTEHMFLGDRRQLVETLILAESEEERNAALDQLEPLQKQDFLEIFEAMDGLPTTIRLLDPPLHEFLPDLTDLSVRVALAEERGEQDEGTLRLLAAVQAMHEQNPMLGLRGVRLGLVVPGLFTMQVRAIAEAAAERKKAGGDPRPEIMIPLVGAVQELEAIREEAEKVLAEVAEAEGVDVPATDRHHDRGAARGAHRRRDRRGGRLLLLRHQRPDPDDLGLLARRRRGGVLPRLPRQGHLRHLAVRVAGRPRRRPAGRDRGRGRPRRPSPTSSSASAASTAATPTRCTSSTRSGWTTCPARRSGCRWRGWRPGGRRWAGSGRLLRLLSRPRPRCSRSRSCSRGGAGTCIVMRVGGSVGKNSPNRAFISGKSASSATSTVVLTTRSGRLPATRSTVARFANAWRAWPPKESGTSPVAGIDAGLARRRGRSRLRGRRASTGPIDGGRSEPVTTWTIHGRVLSCDCSRTCPRQPPPMSLRRERCARHSFPRGPHGVGGDVVPMTRGGAAREPGRPGGRGRRPGVPAAGRLHGAGDLVDGAAGLPAVVRRDRGARVGAVQRRAVVDLRGAAGARAEAVRRPVSRRSS